MLVSIYWLQLVIFLAVSLPINLNSACQIAVNVCACTVPIVMNTEADLGQQSCVEQDQTAPKE